MKIHRASVFCFVENGQNLWNRLFEMENALFYYVYSGKNGKLVDAGSHLSIYVPGSTHTKASYFFFFPWIFSLTILILSLSSSFFINKVDIPFTG